MITRNGDADENENANANGDKKLSSRPAARLACSVWLVLEKLDRESRCSAILGRVGI